MKNKIYLMFFIFITISCSDKNKVAEVTKEKVRINQNIDAKKLIKLLESYEYSSHKIFQKKIYKLSDDFIKKQSAKFVDNETGFLKLWSEAFSCFESDIKKNEKWKSRLEKYFKNTEYMTYISEQEKNYVTTINQQRKELLGKLYLDENTLNLPQLNLSVLNSSNQIEKVIAKVNNLVLIEVIPEVIEDIIVPLLFLSLIAFFGVFLPKWLKIIPFILLLIFSVWQNIKYSNELETEISNKFKLENNSHLSILEALDQNTNLYYSEIQKKIK